MGTPRRGAPRCAPAAVRAPCRGANPRLLPQRHVAGRRLERHRPLPVPDRPRQSISPLPRHLERKLGVDVPAAGLDVDRDAAELGAITSTSPEPVSTDRSSTSRVSPRRMLPLPVSTCTPRRGASHDDVPGPGVHLELGTGEPVDPDVAGTGVEGKGRGGDGGQLDVALSRCPRSAVARVLDGHVARAGGRSRARLRSQSSTSPADVSTEMVLFTLASVTLPMPRLRSRQRRRHQHLDIGPR